MDLFQNSMAEEQEDTLHGKYLLFAIGEEVYGVEVGYVHEIISMQPINQLPETHEYFKGVINLRGKIIPAVDMRLRFKKQDKEYTDRTCIVVVETSSLSAGLIVDAVEDVVVIDDQDIAPPPGFEIGTAKRYIKGIGKVDNEVKLLLDCENLFNAQEIQLLEDIQEGKLEKKVSKAKRTKKA